MQLLCHIKDEQSALPWSQCSAVPPEIPGVHSGPLCINFFCLIMNLAVNSEKFPMNLFILKGAVNDACQESLGPVSRPTRHANPTFRGESTQVSTDRSGHEDTRRCDNQHDIDNRPCLSILSARFEQGLIIAIPTNRLMRRW